jgi:hypothetical protein
VTPDDTCATQDVFCDFETRNTGGCDLTKAGASRYAADEKTEILIFGYRTGGVDYSWAPGVKTGLTPDDTCAVPTEPAKAPVSDRRLRALDIFCGAGCATLGLRQAGFTHITGVDIEDHQSNYCGDAFVQMDAIEYLQTADLSQFDYIHASPPCKFFTELGHSFEIKKHFVDLITPTRPLLEASGLPWVIENVPKARPYLRDPITLCASMFPGLETATHQLRRHRLFESNFSLAAPSACRHKGKGGKPVGGIYGGHGRDRRRPKAGGPNPEHQSGSNLSWEDQFVLMGVPVGSMTLDELSEGIPPIYARYIAEAWMKQAGVTAPAPSIAMSESVTVSAPMSVAVPVSRDPLERLAADPAMTFVCFGGLEQAIWREIMVGRHGFPPIETRRWLDLRAVASSFALPRSLDKALAALGTPIKKDMAGQRLVRSLSRPNHRSGAYPELTPAILERVTAYNRGDILALETMHGRGLGALPPGEQAVWELDQRINARGIKIDVEFVEAAKRIADQVMGEAIAEFKSLTGGILPTQVQKTRDWLQDRQCALPNLEAETIEEALEAPGLPDNVRRALEIRLIVAAASLKKLNAMLAVVGPDGRARGLLQYHGASTGRWSGQLIQPQNFPRPTLEADVDPEELAAAVRSGDPERLRAHGKPVDVLVSALRCALIAAEDQLLGAGDFSMIEACILLALAGQHDKCALIAQGADVYRDKSAAIYGLDRAAFMAIPEDELTPEQVEQRRIGKNAVLGCGYGIGAEGFYRRFCRHVENGKELAARIVAIYRNQWAPAVPKLWRDLETTARRAMLRPG